MSLFINVFLMTPHHLSNHHSPSKISPFIPIFQHNLELSSKIPKITPYFLSDLTPLTSPQIKKSLENKGFPALHIIYEPPSTEHYFVKSYFNILHFKHSAIIVDFCINSTFHIFRTELYSEFIFIPFYTKKKP